MTSAAAPVFPPLLTGLAAPAGADPMAKALALAATEDADPGTIVYAEDDAALRAAVILAPEMPLSRAIGVSFAVLLGFADALGALAPPEVAVHFTWPGGIKVNGATCGGLRAAASTDDPGAEPAWLVLALDVPHRLDGTPGADPTRTALAEEGCADVGIPALLEAWARHMLGWIHRFTTEGMGPLHAEWRAKASRRCRCRSPARRARPDPA